MADLILSDCDPKYCSDLSAQLAGELSHLKAIVDELVPTVAELKAKLQLVTEGQLGLSAKLGEREKMTQRWVEYDSILKTRFLSLKEDGSDWESWALLYWYRWCLRQTDRKDPITSWGDYKVRVQKAQALVDELGSVTTAKDYLEYVAFHQTNLTFHQACASGWVGKLSPQVKPWIDDKVAEAVMADTSNGAEALTHPVVQKNMKSWETTNV